MSRRIIAAKPSIENVQQIQSTLRAVGSTFEAKNAPEKTLGDEIEACRKLIWQCVQNSQHANVVSTKKEETTEHSSKEESKIVDDEPKAAPSIPPTNSVAPTSNPAPKSTAPASGPKNHPSRVNIEFRVNAMKVVDLKKELKARDLDSNGLKKQLQSRLREAMFAEFDMQQNDNPVTKVENVKQVPSDNTSDKPEEKVPSIVDEPEAVAEQENVETAMEVSEEEPVLVKSAEPYPPVVVMTDDAKLKDSCGKVSVDEQREEQPKQKEDKHPVVVAPLNKVGEQGASSIKQYWKNKSKPTHTSAMSPMKLPTKTTNTPSASPMKVPSIINSATKAVKKSPLRMVVKAVKKTIPVSSESDDSSQDLMIAESKSDLTDDDFDRPMSDFSGNSAPAPTPAPTAADSMSKTGSVRDLVSKIQNGSSFPSSASRGGSGSGASGNSTSALSKNLQAKKEARLARMAEIRGKSKPVVTSKLVLAPKEYSSTLSSLNAVSAASNSKKNNLAAQMREKAAAAAMRKENVSSSANQPTSTTGNGKRNLPTATSSSTFGKETSGNTFKQAFPKKPKVASPMETYEISDREESDSDSSDSEAENAKNKKIPLWAQKVNLLPALEQQYNGCVEGRRVDPDDIFPEVQTCDLEAIFGGKKSRYTRRTSSGNWTRDKVTAAEKLVYKRTMGFESSN